MQSWWIHTSSDRRPAMSWGYENIYSRNYTRSRGQLWLKLWDAMQLKQDEPTPVRSLDSTQFTVWTANQHWCLIKCHRHQEPKEISQSSIILAKLGWTLDIKHFPGVLGKNGKFKLHTFSLDYIGEGQWLWCHRHVAVPCWRTKASLNWNCVLGLFWDLLVSANIG